MAGVLVTYPFLLPGRESERSMAGHLVTLTNNSHVFVRAVPKLVEP